jgi:membrane protein DedA with SNARE-associated domain
MYTVNILNHFVENNLVFTYFIIFLITIFEGEIVSISAGILVLLGALNFYLVLVVIFCGGMVKTFLGYFLGQCLHRKFNNNRFLRYVEKRVLNIMPHFERKPFWSIFLSKFLMINHLVIIFAGYKNINFKKYIEAEISSTLFWVPGLVLLGYFFSYTAIRISHEIWTFSLIVLLLTLLFIIVDKLVAWVYDIFEELYDN